MMENDILAAIRVIRLKLDEIEKMVSELPHEIPSTGITSGYSPSRQFHDWCDQHEVEKDYKARRNFYILAQLADEGLTREQIRHHRRIRNKRSITPMVDLFLDKWENK